MFQDVLGCFRCSGTLRDAQGGSRMLNRNCMDLECFRDAGDSLRCSGVPLRCPGMPRDTQGCSGMLRDAQGPITMFVIVFID